MFNIFLIMLSSFRQDIKKAATPSRDVSFTHGFQESAIFNYKWTSDPIFWGISFMGFIPPTLTVH